MTATRSGCTAKRLASACALACIWWAAPAAAQGTPPSPAVVDTTVLVRVRDAGPGASGRLLREILARPHVTIRARGAPVALPRDSTIATTVVVLDGPVTVASRVHGDVVVVRGDLFLHPGAEIDGRAIAVGGGVYNSTLATVKGGRLAFRENTFRVVDVTAEEVALDYEGLAAPHESLVYLPFIAGFRLPLYDRSDGLSVAWGPTLALDTGRVEVDPVIVYRSQLGVVDPTLHARADLTRRTTIEAAVERTTLTNDAWIRSDLANSATAFFAGTDVRNYYRADRADVRARRIYETADGSYEPFVGARFERSSSVRPTVSAQGGPWSALKRHDRVDGMLRPNPPIDGRDIGSAFLGDRFSHDAPDLGAHATVQLEQSFSTPSGGQFTQATLDGDVAFPTFGTQRFEFVGHAVVSAGDSTPRQRYAYLGGSGTIPTLDVLALGGDELLFVEGRYLVPLERFTLPFLGAPTVGLRYVAGTAGVRGSVPTIVQNVGVRVSMSFLQADVVVDPASRRTSTSVGIAVFR